MAEFDPDLLLPRLLPTVAGVALAGWRLRPRTRAVREDPV
jgi:hypothetical protein